MKKKSPTRKPNPFMTYEQLPKGSWQREWHMRGNRFPVKPRSENPPPALDRGSNGEAKIQPNEKGRWCYVYEDGMLDTGSEVNMSNPYIKLEAEPIVPADERESDLGSTAARQLAQVA